FPKMTGRMFDERLGKWHFWTTFVFFNLTFGPMHVLGLQGMPRRVATYASKFADMNLFISIASFGLGVSTLIFLYNIVTSWRGGPGHALPPGGAPEQALGGLGDLRRGGARIGAGASRPRAVRPRARGDRGDRRSRRCGPLPGDHGRRGPAAAR